MPGNGVRRALGILQVFIGLGAVVGGVALVSDPSGNKIQMPLMLLENSPFSDFLIPGLVLLAVNGVGSLLGAVLTLKRRPGARTLAVALGLFLMAWIVVQVYWIRALHWLHVLYFGLGLLEVVLGLRVVSRAPGVVRVGRNRV